MVIGVWKLKSSPQQELRKVPCGRGCTSQTTCRDRHGRGTRVNVPDLRLHRERRGHCPSRPFIKLNAKENSPDVRGVVATTPNLDTSLYQSGDGLPSLEVAGRWGLGGVLSQRGELPRWGNGPQSNNTKALRSIDTTSLPRCGRPPSRGIVISPGAFLCDRRRVRARDALRRRWHGKEAFMNKHNLRLMGGANVEFIAAASDGDSLFKAAPVALQNAPVVQMAPQDASSGVSAFFGTW